MKENNKPGGGLLEKLATMTIWSVILMTAKNETSCKTCALSDSCGLKTHRKQYCMCHTLVVPTIDKNPENSTDLITVSRSNLEKVLEAVECERIYELYSQCPDDFWTHDKCVECLLNFIKGDAN